MCQLMDLTLTRSEQLNAHASLPLAFDRSRQGPAARVFARTKAVESRFAILLRRIAGHVQHLMQAFDTTNPSMANEMERQLEEYAKVIEPWAKSVSQRMLAEIASRDWQAWQEVSARIGRGVKEAVRDAPTGLVMQRLLRDQTSLITSIPREAAERVRRLTLEGISGSKRPAAYVEEIMKQGQVSRAKATLIARTEVARTASVLTQVRAQHIGSTHFIWRTARDSDVRASHKALEGKVFAWDDPPLCDPPNHRSLPGQIYNCRCVAEVVIPESLFD